MPLQPALPTPLTKWAKWLLRKLGQVGFEVAVTLVDFASEVPPASDWQWRYVVLRFTKPQITGAVEDEAQIGFHLINITGGDIDTTWTAGDFANVVTDITEWWNTVKGQIDNGYTLKEARFYRKKFATVMTADERFQDSGPPVHVAPINSPATSVGGTNTQQVSMSVTFKTPLPRHWGRVYMPGLSVAQLDNDGRWTSAARTTMANAWAELFDDLATREFFPFVPITQHDGVIMPGAAGITSIQVDDIPDVVRRRRPKTTLARTIGTPTA